MEVLDVSSRIFKFADSHAYQVDRLLNQPNNELSTADAAKLNFEITMMGSMWQLASSMVRDLSDPLKSIVNK